MGRVRRRRTQYLVIPTAALGLMSTLWTLTTPAASAATSVPAITWLAAGDSYASGQGLTHPSGLCARGTGTDGSGSTWAISAAAKLRKAGIDIAGSDPDLVACTGAISADLLADNSKKLGPKHAAQWTPKMGRFDLVTFSFGGDDVGFAGIMAHCEEFGCPSDASVRAKITALADNGVTIKGVKTQPYHTFLDNVAKTAVAKGGNIVVMGYPEIVEDVGLWSAGRTTCAGMSAGEDQRLRGWAGDLNATIGSAVSEVNALPATQRNDVHLTFIDSVTGQSADGIPDNDPNLFEPSAGTRHELCSQGSQPWINNEIKTDKSRSFHPNQAGENALGALAASVIEHLTWPWSTAAPAAPAAPAPPSTAAAPLLGADWCGTYCVGYGTVAPATVFNGGDETGQVQDITWHNWGAAEATGTGKGWWVPNNTTVADGEYAQATLVAFDLGTCGNGPAYTKIEWTFPEFNYNFDPSTNYIDICSGTYGPSGNTGDTGNTGTGASPTPATVPPPSGNSGNTGPSGNSGSTGSSGNTGSTGNSGNSGQ